MMEKRILGKTGFAVTALGYGAMALRPSGEQEAMRMLNAVLDGGINFIDTAPSYGLSEAYIGKAIAHRRDEFYLATKCGDNVDQVGKGLKPRKIWSREKLLANIETSLRLLKTDHIDVWQLHSAFPYELHGGKNDQVIQTMKDLKQQGKVRYIGISLKSGKPGEELYPAGYGFKYAQEFMQWGVFDVMQIVYGGLTRENEMAIAKAAGMGIGVMVRGVVKKYWDNYDKLFEKARLNELCAKGESNSDFLIRFALSHRGISTMIIGTQNLDHLTANIKAATEGMLPDDIYLEAKHRLDAVGIVMGEMQAI
jgi:aryl-alcohol dehydrogenase-like predicted oxidoreductase